jgi:hypothetical protein
VSGRRIAACLLIVTIAIAVTACSDDTAAYEHPAAVAVAGVLELRSAGNTDTVAYEPFFSDPALAAQLAGNTSPGTSAVPDWQEPYVSRLADESADVVVRWDDAAGAFPDWPKVTVFSLSLLDGRWVIVDATDPPGTTPPPLTDEQLSDKTVGN